MEEYLESISSYLPIRFVDLEANEFVEYLSEAYRENFEKGKYQFAFTAFHMLNMIFIYKTKWFLREQGNQSIIESLNNQTDKVFSSLFDLSQISEKTSLEKLLRSLRFHINDITICKNHVQVRNNCSHASGRIYYETEEKIEYFIKEEIEFVKKIHGKLKHELTKFLQIFIEENWDKSFISGDFKNLFEENYFSIKDLEVISEVDLDLFKEKSNNEKNIKQKIIYLLFVFEIQDQIKSDENLFLKKLPILMIDLPEKIEIEKDGNIEEMYISEMIEEKLMPVIGKFSDEDIEKSEKILKLV